MINVIVILILLLIAVGIITYLVRAGNHGETCIGCPHARQCGGKCSGNCNNNGS